MGRRPCCDNNSGLNKGPWSSEEDRILTSFINQNGHDNWRALPKRAGLTRCGKSCRLRWMNYLRPDIKRGNFSVDEEGMIVKLHQELGNKWSIIAAKLPGRTDNEIKNVWHTHLKKRLNIKSQSKSNANIQEIGSYSMEMSAEATSSFGETSSVSTVVDGGSDAYVTLESPLKNLIEIGENFWSEVFSNENWIDNSDFSSGDNDSQIQYLDSSASHFNMEVGNDFWQNVFCKPELFQF